MTGAMSQVINLFASWIFSHLSLSCFHLYPEGSFSSFSVHTIAKIYQQKWNKKNEKETTEWNAKRSFFGRIYVFPISQKFERI